ncbi:hypothetical protein GCM10009862_23200 [Microbacterium binotii]|uniref:Large ribosomal subunit protein bL36 n=1 Tax=Microbacterium binotii TaxID=462710 RepID=A0ABN3PHG4_9MICO
MRRRGTVFVINKLNPRFKGRQGWRAGGPHPCRAKSGRDGGSRNFGCADFGAAAEARNYAGPAVFPRRINGARAASESRIVRF